MAKGIPVGYIDDVAKAFDLPDWDKIREINVEHIFSFADGIEDEEERAAAEEKGEEEVYRQWSNAVTSAAEQTLERVGLELVEKKKKVRGGFATTYEIAPTKDWNDAASKLVQVINGVGNFHFNSLSEFLDSGPYTAREAVAKHWTYANIYSDVYGAASPKRIYERAW